MRPGRATRCVRCAHQWAPLAEPAAATPDPPSVEPAPQPAPTATPVPELPPPQAHVPTAMERLMSAAYHPPPPSMALRLAWAGSVAVLMVLVGGLYAQRGALIELWPPSLRLYAALGVAPGAESPHRMPEPKQEGTDHGGQTQQQPADRDRRTH